MRSRAEWVIEIDLMGQAFPHPKEGWLRLKIRPDVAEELLGDLEIILKHKK